MNRRQKTGEAGEALAERYLRKMGYRILERNFRTRAGEIDIIAREGKTLVFVEVKTRRSTVYGSPKMAITSRKQRKISMAALWYLKMNNFSHADARFDVLTIQSTGDEVAVDLIKNAFDLAYP